MVTRENFFTIGELIVEAKQRRQLFPRCFKDPRESNPLVAWVTSSYPRALTSSLHQCRQIELLFWIPPLSAGDDGVVAPFGDRFFQPSCRLSSSRCDSATTMHPIPAQQMPSGLKRRRHLGVTSGACKLLNESKPLLGLALGTGDSTEHPFLVTHSSLL